FETWSGNTPQDPAKYLNGAILPGSQKGLEDGGGWFDPLAPLRTLSSKIGGWFTDKFLRGGFFVDAAKDTATGAIDGVIDWLDSKMGGASDDSGGGTGNASGGVIKQVRDVAEGYGWDSGAQWTALSQLINKESSWNPNAANPSSTARGLFQKMTCLVTDAEILTRDGWKTHDEVQVGDETLGYNPETGRSECTTIKRVVHYDNAPIVHMVNGRVADRSTPNHRWLTEQRYASVTELMVE